MRKWMMIFSICLFLMGMAGIYNVYSGYHKGQEEYIRLKNAYRETEDLIPSEVGQKLLKRYPEEQKEDVLPEDAPFPAVINFLELKKINEDVVAWIDIPILSLSYPILQAKDNEYYLNRDIYKEELYSGSIFLDAGNDRNFQDYNSIVYGHNMRDGSMFAELKNLQKEELFQCPYFWIYTEKQKMLYRIFSVYQTENESSSFQTGFCNLSDYQKWKEEMKNMDTMGIGNMESHYDNVVTLSTCTENSQRKFVVQGIKIAVVF